MAVVSDEFLLEKGRDGESDVLPARLEAVSAAPPRAALALLAVCERVDMLSSATSLSSSAVLSALCFRSVRGRRCGMRSQSLEVQTRLTSRLERRTGSLGGRSSLVVDGLGGSEDLVLCRAGGKKKGDRVRFVWHPPMARERRERAHSWRRRRPCWRRTGRGREIGRWFG